MRLLISLVSFFCLVKALPTTNSKPALSQNGKLFNAVAQELSLRDERNGDHKPRVILYSQNRAQVNGKPLSLLPLVEQDTGITHIIISSLHIDRMPGDIYLNDDPPHAPVYQSLWPEVKVLQSKGIKVMVMLGGAGQGSYSMNSLGGNETVFQAYYQPLLKFLRHYNFDGIDLDIEEFVEMEVPLRLLKSLRKDMGPSFILTMAPVAVALQYTDGINISGFNYFDLDSNATDASGKHLVDWYNTQFYSSFGDAGTPEAYQWIMRKGWDPERVVLGVLTNSNDGFGFVETRYVVETIKSLRKEFPGFGGVFGWDYFDAGMSEVDGGTEPWQWVKIIREALYGLLSRRGVSRTKMSHK